MVNSNSKGLSKIARICAIMGCLAAMTASADDYFLAGGQTDTITADATYDQMFVQGDLTIAADVTVSAAKFLMASNETSRLTLGDAAKLYVTSATNENGLDALFGTRGGHAYVTLGTRAAVEITGKACFGYCVNASTPAYSTVDLGTNASWKATITTYFNRGSSITLAGFTVDTVLSTLTLNKGAKIVGQIIRNGTNAFLIRFAGGRLDEAQLWSNQSGQNILEAVDGADIRFRKSGTVVFLIGSDSTASLTLRGNGDFVKFDPGNPPLFEHSATRSSGPFNWQMEGNMRIDGGGLRITEPIDIGSSRVVCSTGTALSVESTLRTAGVDSYGYGSFDLTNRVPSKGTGTLSLCGSGDLCGSLYGANLHVESGANVRLAGPSAIGYRFYRFLLTEGDGSSRSGMQISEIVLLNGDEDVTRKTGVKYSSGDPFSTSTTENYTMAVDGNTATKWYMPNAKPDNMSQSNEWLQVEFPAPQPVTGYKWATGNDKPRETETHDAYCRDPKAWSLLGSNDGKNWVVLDEVADYPFHKPRCAFTGDTFVPVLPEMPVVAPCIEVENGGTLDLAGTALAGDVALVAENASVSGTLHVASGGVTCRSEMISAKYWRLSITNLKGPNPGCTQMSEFALYDRDGTRLNSGLTNAGNAVPASSLAAGQYSSFKGTVALPTAGGEGVSNLFDNAVSTKMCSGVVPTTETPVIIVMRLADTAAPVCSYLFASANDHEERDPSDWTLEASADGTSWATVDMRTGVTTSSTRKSYNAYNDGVPYTVSSAPLNGAVLALGTTVKVDPGASLSFAAAPTPVSSLAVDGGGAGAIDTLTVAPNGALHLTGVPRAALSGYIVPLTIGQIAQRENLRSWTVYLDGVVQRNAKLLVQGSTLYIGQGGTIVIFR